MFISSRQTFFPCLTVLLMTACSRGSEPSDSDGADHEDLRGAVAAVKADTGTTKTNTELLKAGVAAAQAEFADLGTELDTALDGLTADMAAVKGGAGALQTAAAAIHSDTTAIHSDTTALRSDVTALRASVGTGLTTQLSGVQTSVGTLPPGSSLYTTLMAARRYSKTCNPATDTWLSAAWPGLSDAEVMDACLRDGRWHSLGTLRDVITGALALPEDMQVGLGTYSRNITPATINGWDPGIQLCLAHFPVGDGYVIDGAALVHECVSITGKKFTITHKVADQTNSSFLQRDYTNYAGGSESTLPCSVTGGGFVSCSSKEALASHWRIYVRQ